MNTLPIVATFFDRGAKAATDLINHEVGEGRLVPGAIVGRDMLNLVMLQLLILRAQQALSEVELRRFVDQFEAAEISDGTRVVYAMLAFDLAREAEIDLNLTKRIRASGEQIDWELLSALEIATPAFAKRARLLINARKAQGVQKSDD